MEMGIGSDWRSPVALTVPANSQRWCGGEGLLNGVYGEGKKNRSVSSEEKPLRHHAPKLDTCTGTETLKLEMFLRLDEAPQVCNMPSISFANFRRPLSKSYFISPVL